MLRRGARLGVRRESVSQAALALQEAGLIRYGRGQIRVLDRAGLERRACECYAAVRREYDRLLPAQASAPAHPVPRQPSGETETRSPPGAARRAEFGSNASGG
jgi:hypothetical protein